LKAIDASGDLEDLGVAVLDCQQCARSKFGYPNDEGLPEHRLYRCGMGETETSVLEVVDSLWAKEVSEMMAASARRIWGGRGMDAGWVSELQLRHFIVMLKEATFACVASSLAVVRFFPPFDEAFANVIEKLKEH
jgi:hypothetical protein